MYCRYGMLDKLNTADPRGHMRASYQDSRPLQSCLLSGHLASQLDAAVEEAVSSGAWADALAHLPPAVTPSDAAMLMGQAWQQQPKGAILFLHFPGKGMQS